MNAAEVRQTIGGTWVEHPYGWCRRLPLSAIRDAAKEMLICGARFAAMVATPECAGGLRICWNWDIGGVLLSIESAAASNTALPSIVDIYPGADWAERETRDYYAVSFDHRTSTPPLMLRIGDNPGVLLRGEGERL